MPLWSTTFVSVGCTTIKTTAELELTSVPSPPPRRAPSRWPQYSRCASASASATRASDKLIGSFDSSARAAAMAGISLRRGCIMRLAVDPHRRTLCRCIRAIFAERDANDAETVLSST